MPFWSNINFIDSNSPIIEQIIFFHDHSIITITSILTFLFLLIFTLINKKIPIFLNLVENQIIEIIWTTLPIIILCFLALPRLRLLYLMEENFSPSITIKTIGHQWYWSYEYTNFKLNIDSFIIPTNIKNTKIFRLLDTNNSIFLPIITTTRILITSSDVIHSWTIQRLGIKTDAVPGRLNQINIFPSRAGNFFGQCSEICGANHRFIPISIKIVPTKKFLKWISWSKTH